MLIVTAVNISSLSLLFLLGIAVFLYQEAKTQSIPYLEYRSLHNPCNTEKAELTSIFVSGYITLNFHIWKLIQSVYVQPVLQGLCKLLILGIICQ